MGLRPREWCGFPSSERRIVDVKSHRVMVSENRSKISRQGQHTMALDQSALLDLLGELKLTDVTDRIRVATETLYRELIER